MRSTKPLLFELFLHLHREGLPLGIDDYLDLLTLLSHGIGGNGVDGLRAACQLLWAKSPEDLVRVDEAITTLVAPRLGLKPEVPKGGAFPPVEAPSDPDTTGPPGEPGIGGSELAHRPSGNEERPLRHGAVPVGELRYSKDAKAPPPTGTYQLTSRLPMSRREMATIWRHLRTLQRSGAEVELDVEGTIDRISRHGFLAYPVMRPLRRNQARLLVVLDRSAEMAPYAPFMDAFLDSVRKGGLLGRVITYYFGQTPGNVLFAQPDLSESRPLDQVLKDHATSGSVVVVSEAGAARREYSLERTRSIQEFLKAVRDITYRYAWLNPLPKQRWPASTAANVDRMVPAFPMDRDGMLDAVRILRGHPFPPGVNLDVSW